VRTQLEGFRESQAIVTVASGSRTELPFNIRVGELQDRSPELAPPFGNRGGVYIRADTQTRDGDIIRYRGNVRMRTEGSEISADELDFNLDTRTADVRGNVQVRVLRPEYGVVPLTKR
jgi:lipopolysaccharide assembly outer membrane protein LptD (OstA)